MKDAVGLSFNTTSIKVKLIALFIVIKVAPLLLMAWYVLTVTEELTQSVSGQAEKISTSSKKNVSNIAKIAINDSIDALDNKSREAIERLTVDTAKSVASFLYERDANIKIASNLQINQASYASFLASLNSPVIQQGEWRINTTQKEWVAVTPLKQGKTVQAKLTDNSKRFHSKEVHEPHQILKPLYLSMSFIGINGQEKLKINTSHLFSNKLLDVSKKENTFVKSENYFARLSQLQDNEIYVSPVIGAYVGSSVIGKYTPETATKKGIKFEPEKSAYAGKENPLGEKFQGIVRWAMPVVREGRRIGYVSLALDHTHIMQFTDNILPTEERYSEISDASTGNYAFMWDNLGRNISHPRDYFIVGYDANTGELVEPWLEKTMYEKWKKSNLSIADFLGAQPTYYQQSLKNKPAVAQIKKGTLALDCRYLNFAPQCQGWNNLTTYGGSGSFVIFWSKLWKLTTAAAIPYFTGDYKNSKKGFGFVTIGANVNEFHAPAIASKALIEKNEKTFVSAIGKTSSDARTKIEEVFSSMSFGLIASTLIMVLIVVAIAVFIASAITQRITRLSKGIKSFQSGNYGHRLEVTSNDELGRLTQDFNEMSNQVEKSIALMKSARDKAQENDQLKNDFLAYVSHELRTPLNSIIGLSDHLREGLTDKQEKKSAQFVYENGMHLLSVVEDILDLAQIEAGRFKLNIETFKLDQSFLDGICDTYKNKAKQKLLGFNVKNNESLYVTNDKTRIKQVLVNLLDNAVKFTDSGEVGLTLKSNKQYIDFYVSDTGLGVSQEHQNKIFNKFYQEQSFTDRKAQGIGIGLSLSKQLSILMGGDITVSSEVNKGTCFIFSILKTIKTKDEKSANC